MIIVHLINEFSRTQKVPKVKKLTNQIKIIRWHGGLQTSVVLTVYNHIYISRERILSQFHSGFINFNRWNLLPVGKKKTSMGIVSRWVPSGFSGFLRPLQHVPEGKLTRRNPPRCEWGCVGVLPGNASHPGLCSCLTPSVPGMGSRTTVTLNHVQGIKIMMMIIIIMLFLVMYLSCQILLGTMWQWHSRDKDVKKRDKICIISYGYGIIFILLCNTMS